MPRRVSCAPFLPLALAALAAASDIGHSAVVETMDGHVYIGTLKWQDAGTLLIEPKSSPGRIVFPTDIYRVNTASNSANIGTLTKVTIEQHVPLNQSATDALQGLIAHGARKALTDARTANQPDSDVGIGSPVEWTFGWNGPENRQLDSFSLWFRDAKTQQYQGHLESLDGKNFIPITGTTVDITLPQNPNPQVFRFNHINYDFAPGSVVGPHILRWVFSNPLDRRLQLRVVETDGFMSTVVPEPRPRHGILLRDGTIIVGLPSNITTTGLKIGTVTTPGNFDPRRKQNEFRTDQLAGVIFNKLSPKALDAAPDGQTGVILPNGDFVAGDFTSFQDGKINLSTVLFGAMSMPASEAMALTLGPRSPVGDWEVALMDGSLLQARSLTWSPLGLRLTLANGDMLSVPFDQCYELRAGKPRKKDIATLLSKSGPILLAAGGSQTIPLDGKSQLLRGTVEVTAPVDPDADKNANAPLSTTATITFLADSKPVLKLPELHNTDGPCGVAINLTGVKLLTITTAGNGGVTCKLIAANAAGQH